MLEFMVSALLGVFILFLIVVLILVIKDLFL